MNKGFENLYLPEKENKVFTIIINVLIILVTLLFILMMIFEPVLVSGSSMRDTVFNNDIAIMNVLDDDVDNGDIIILKKSQKENIFIIKRVVAVEGEEICFLKEGKNVALYKKQGEEFLKVDEPFIREPMVYSPIVFSNRYCPVANKKDELSTNSLVIPKDHIYVLGDNRNQSSDSRHYGVFDKSLVKGSVIRFVKQNTFAYKFYDFIYGSKKSTIN